MNNEFLWVTGGLNDENEALASTELVTAHGSFPYVELPDALYGHCITAFNDTSALLTYHAGVFLFDMETQSWTAAPLMLQIRQYHGCGTFTMNHATYAMVAGGFNADTMRTIDTVEILDLDEVDQGWIQGRILYKYTGRISYV